MATRQIAQGLAGLGRYGDSTLVHMQPEEVAGLQALAKTQGTSLSINPQTGLPEAFNLGGFFKSLLPVFAGAATGGAGAPLWAGIAAGAATGAVTNRKDPLMGAVMGGMGGYGGFNIGQGFANAGAGAAAPAAGGVQVAGSTVPTGTGVQLGQGAAQQIGTPQLNQALAQSGVNFDPIARGTAQNIVANTGPGVAFKNTFAQSSLPGDVGYLGQGVGGTDLMRSGAIGSAVPGGSLTAQQSLANAGQGFENLVTGQEGSWDAFKQGLASAGKAPVSNFSAATTLGMPLGSAVLGGLEPSDIYGEPMRPGQNPNERYDPYRSLNLDTETGLRLYAAGGPVSFADGGDTGKDPAGLPGGGLGSLRGGDAAVTQGAGMLPLDVSDINAKYGLGEEASFVPAPRLGLFADNDQIEAARTSYETQLAAAMSGRGGMGSPFGYGNFGKPNTGMNMMGRVMGSTGQGQPNMVRGMAPNSSPMAAMTRTMGGTGIGATAPTAPTAETALSRLNLNRNYANGGTIQAGGTQDLYGTQDDATTGPMLSRNGYGLGRLQAMADGGVAGYAAGGMTGGGASGMNSSLDRSSPLGQKYYGPKTGGLFEPIRDTNVLIEDAPDTFLSARFSGPGKSITMAELFSKIMPENEKLRQYVLSGPSSRSASPAMQGGDLNLNTASGLGETRLTDTNNAQVQYQPHVSTFLNNPSDRSELRTGYAKGGYLDGAGDGMSDSIPATIEGKQPARLADGEFVIPADVVSHLGNGSTKAGAQRLYGMLDKVRKARTGTKQQGKQIKPEKYMPA